MSYHCGLDLGTGTHGVEPHIRCDTCSAKRFIVANRRTGPPLWFMNGKPPPRWAGGRTEHGGRLDWCPECAAKRKNENTVYKETKNV